MVSPAALLHQAHTWPSRRLLLAAFRVSLVVAPIFPPRQALWRKMLESSFAPVLAALPFPKDTSKDRDPATSEMTPGKPFRRIIHTDIRSEELFR
jgi:hypothetical protein